MGFSVNKAIILGRLGADPDARYTQGGHCVCNLRIATRDREKVSGEWQDVTSWRSAVVWGKLAEIVKDHATKGSNIYVEGRMKTREWQDREGNKRTTTEVIADQVILLDGGGRRQSGGVDGPGFRADDEPKT